MTGVPLAATERGTSLELEGLSKHFGELVAVQRVDLRAAPGEFVSLIGPSGCGKSTVFNIVAGLERPTSGQVVIGGVVPADRLGASAYMPQHDALLPWRKIVDNVILPLELHGVSRKAARRRAGPLLERFGLGGFSSAWPWQLSGGMRQRAALLRTLIDEPPLILLDEPFGALDGITRADLQQWLSDVWSQFGSTVLLVTHDITESVLLSDRVYVMTPRPGRIATVIDVGLPRPRTLAMREEDAFIAVERRLRHELQQAMATAGEFAGPVETR